MTKQTAREYREQREYIAAHEYKIRQRLRNGESYLEIAVHLGISPVVLKHMLEVVLAKVGIHRCPACSSATTRNAPHTAEPG